MQMVPEDKDLCGIMSREEVEPSGHGAIDTARESFINVSEE